MKSILIATCAFITNNTMAFTLNCNYAGLTDLVSANSEAIHVRALSSDEQSSLKSEIDKEHNCNEGVKIKGYDLSVEGVFLKAECWTDSSGKTELTLQLNCK